METDESISFRYIPRMMNAWVKEAVASSGMKQAEVARELHRRYNWNDDRSVINKIINRRRDVSAAEAMHIAAVTGFPLPTGVKPMLVSSFDPDQADESDRDTFDGYSREHWRPTVDGAMPEVDVRLGAGNGIVGDVINLPVGPGSISGHRVVAEWLIPQQYLREEAKAAPNQTVVMEVIGDSMQPSYMPGDRVLVDLSQSNFVSDTVYAISDGFSEPQIKRLQRVPFSNPTQVRIISDNPALETFTVELDRLTIIGRICGHIARK